MNETKHTRQQTDRARTIKCQGQEVRVSRVDGTENTEDGVRILTYGVTGAGTAIFLDLASARSVAHALLHASEFIADLSEYHAGHATNVGGTHGWYDGCPDAQVRP